MSGPLKAGQRVGNYILQDKVGEGAFAQVWKAVHHERPDRIVAVKVPSDPAHWRELRREVSLPVIDHPNVVPILDSDTSGDRPYVVMPYYAGRSLADLIKKHPSGLPEERVEQILADILSGLSVAHELGIVHRDIKPSNILLDGTGRALLSDFGLSRVETMWQSVSLDRERARVVGTLPYMAPEVMDGAEATPASDVYSVGLVLFEMLCGRRPAGLELPSQVRPELRRVKYFDALFYWACRPPAERYADADAFAQAVQGVPRAIPLEPGQPKAPAAVAPPPPAPLPENLWEALAVCWEVRRSTRDRLGAQRERIDEALEIYQETHPEVRALREEEASLEAAERQAVERLRSVCARITQETEALIGPLERRRRDLLTEGCRPNHPEVQAIDRQIATHRKLVKDLLVLAAPAPRNGPTRCRLKSLLEAWIRAKSNPALKGLRSFLGRYGQDPLRNPFAEAARRLQSACATPPATPPVENPFAEGAHRPMFRERCLWAIAWAIAGAHVCAIVLAIIGAFDNGIAGATGGAIGGAILGATGGAIVGAIKGAIWGRQFKFEEPGA